MPSKRPRDTGRTRRTSARPDGGKASDGRWRTRICVVGDSPMVEDYARLCGAHGFEVFFEWNEPPEELPTFESQAVKRSRTTPADISLALELTNIDLDRKRKNIEALDKALPPTSAIVSSSITVTATEQSSWMKHRSRLVGLSALPTLIERPMVEVAPTVFSPKETVEVVERFFRSIGKDLMIVQDRVGMVLPRILCHVINEASFAVQEQIVTPEDLDTAAMLAVAFPAGPLDWADRIGFQQVYAVLSALQRDLQEDRYRIAPLLRQLAQGGPWWRHAPRHIQER